MEQIIIRNKFVKGISSNYNLYIEKNIQTYVI